MRRPPLMPDLLLVQNEFRIAAPTQAGCPLRKPRQMWHQVDLSLYLSCKPNPNAFRGDAEGPLHPLYGGDRERLEAENTPSENTSIHEEYLAGEIGVFVRSDQQLARAKAAVEAAGAEMVELTDEIDVKDGHICIGTMHLAKGLEFRAVVVMACDDEVLPLQERIEAVSDDADLEEVYTTERHLLYVACTRVRDHLLVTGVAPGSEFLGDFKAS